MQCPYCHLEWAPLPPGTQVECDNCHLVFIAPGLAVPPSGSNAGLVGGAGGALLGYALGGPVGLVVGGVIGAIFGARSGSAE